MKSTGIIRNVDGLGRIVLPKDLFHYKPNNRWGESYQYLGEILYPELFHEE